MKDYTILKKNVNVNIGIEWFLRDARDDFYPDFIKYEDIKKYTTEYRDLINNRILNIDRYALVRDYVPKKSGLLRDACMINPVHRILYSSLMHYLFNKIDPKIPSSVYSYRGKKDVELDKYPLNDTYLRWTMFENDFRKALLDESIGAVVITDLASYFDHIIIDKLIEITKSLLGNSITNEDNAITECLSKLLFRFNNDGYGMPHNFDMSSFLGNIYLNDVDMTMQHDDQRYFRWNDDIRIATKNKRSAIEILHKVQTIMYKNRLFLASDKTFIIEKNSAPYNEMIDVRDDKLLGLLQYGLDRKNENILNSLVGQTIERFKYHASSGGNDRKYRAYLSKLCKMSLFKEMKSNIREVIKEYAINRLEDRPDRIDKWIFSFLHVGDQEVNEKIEKLVNGDTLIYSWHIYYLWKYLTIVKSFKPKDETIKLASELIPRSKSEILKAQLMVFVGKYGSPAEKGNLFTDYYNDAASYFLKRAILIAIQEYHGKTKKYDIAKRDTDEHNILIEYLRSLESPKYDSFYEREANIEYESEVIKERAKRGVGMINNKPTRFYLSTNIYDYE